MSEKNDTAPHAEAPHWAVEQDTDPLFPGCVKHISKKHAWGKVTVWLERFDVNDTAGAVEVRFVAPTIEYPDGEEQSVLLPAMGELWVLFERHLDELNIRDLGGQYDVYAGRVEPPHDPRKTFAKVEN